MFREESEMKFWDKIFGTKEDIEYAEDDNNYGFEDDEVYEEEELYSDSGYQNNRTARGGNNSTSVAQDKVINMNVKKTLHFRMFKPTDFANRETGEIADEIIKNNTVILNFENAKSDVSKRTIDFISGVVYTNRGKLIKISDDDIFIILPNNADMTGEEVVNQLSEIGVTFD